MAYTDPRVVSLASQDAQQDADQDAQDSFEWTSTPAGPAPNNAIGQSVPVNGLEPPVNVASDPTDNAGQLTPDQARWYVLNKISSGEAGRYNELFGGGSFDSYAQHPNIRIPVPNSSDVSTAAGKYQFINSTWQSQAQKLGLKDFSPANQDTAAWDLAQTTYKQQTGRDLQTDAAKQNVDWSALGSQWTSLKGAQSGASTSGYSAPSNALSLKSAVDSTGAAQAPAQQGLLTNPSVKRLMTLMMLKSAISGVQLQRVDYDPWKVIAGSSTGPTEGPL